MVEKSIDDLTPNDFMCGTTIMLPNHDGDYVYDSHTFTVTSIGRIAYAVEHSTGVNWTRPQFITFYTKRGHNMCRVSRG